MTAEAVQLHVRRGATARSRLAQLRTRLTGRLNFGLYAEVTRYGLCRDLALPIEKPNAKIAILVRSLENHDLSSLFRNDIAKNDLAERLDIAWRLAFIDKGARRGFVAIDSRSETPCYVSMAL